MFHLRANATQHIFSVSLEFVLQAALIRIRIGCLCNALQANCLQLGIYVISCEISSRIPQLLGTELFQRKVLNVYCF